MRKNSATANYMVCAKWRRRWALTSLLNNQLHNQFLESVEKPISSNRLVVTADHEFSRPRRKRVTMSRISTAIVERTKAPDEGMANHLSDSFAAPVLPSPGARKPAHIQKME